MVRRLNANRNADWLGEHLADRPIRLNQTCTQAEDSKASCAVLDFKGGALTPPLNQESLNTPLETQQLVSRGNPRGMICNSIAD